MSAQTPLLTIVVRGVLFSESLAVVNYPLIFVFCMATGDFFRKNSLS